MTAEHSDDEILKAQAQFQLAARLLESALEKEGGDRTLMVSKALREAEDGGEALDMETSFH